MKATESLQQTWLLGTYKLCLQLISLIIAILSSSKKWEISATKEIGQSNFSLSATIDLNPRCQVRTIAGRLHTMGSNIFWCAAYLSKEEIEKGIGLKQCDILRFIWHHHVQQQPPTVVPAKVRADIADVLLTDSWQTPDTLLTHSWHTPDTLLMDSWHTPDVLLTYSWHTPDAFLTDSWWTPDLCL